jgi:hypothetical protein
MNQWPTRPASKEKAIDYERGLGLAAVKAAWGVIVIGQRIVRVAERMEDHAGEPYTVLCNIAWRLMTLGERVEALGEALEARADLWARRAGCDIEALLAAHTA